MQVVTAYKNKEGGCRKLARRFNVSMSTITLWCRNYDIFGESAFEPGRKQKTWKAETKLAAVREYAFGNASIQDICKKYKISSQTIFRKWLMVYNDSHKELKSTGCGRNKPMTKGRKVTFDEKVDIVKYCISHNRNYYDTMDKFKVSYQQIYSWIRKYDEKGVYGLIDRRGKAKPESELTDEDRLKARNNLLEAENDRLRLENAILKKLQEIERRRR